MSTTAALARAQRRHKILRRQQISLAEKNTKDDMIDGELRKLELEFPELKTESAPEAAASPSPNATPAPPTPQPTTPTTFRPTSVIAAAVPSNLDALGTSAAGTDDQPMSPFSRSPVRMEVFSWWLVRLYTAAHHRSLFGPINFIKVVVTSSLIAGIHCFLVDPCSDLGASLQPSFICLMIHVGVLYSLFLRRPDVLTMPMLVVYFALDALPSIALAMVTYSLTMCMLYICGAPRLPLLCT